MFLWRGSGQAASGGGIDCTLAAGRLELRGAEGAVTLGSQRSWPVCGMFYGLIYVTVHVVDQEGGDKDVNV